MKKPIHSAYAHRRDAARGGERIKRSLFVIGFAAAVALILTQRQRDATASASSFSFGMAQAQDLREQLDAARGELALANAQLARAREIFAFSERYRVGAELAGSVYDFALAEGIDPELGFRLVKLESDFKERAVSPVGAVGLAQLMPGTAKFLDKTITREKLYDRETNLRLGFRYLRGLIRENKGDVKMALVVYNRGPGAVRAALALGLDPRNGYERIVTKGYTGKGVID